MTQTTAIRPVVVIAGAHPQADALASSIGNAATVHHINSRERYVSRLADIRAALIVIDGDSDGWQFWAVTPQSSPATRRITVIISTDSADMRTTAAQSGVDIITAPDELLQQVMAVIAEKQASIQQTHDTLCKACAQALPPEAVEGVRLFNAGEYYRQHDVFEALWMETDGPVRDLYRAILQVGIAYYQVERGNQRGALKMLLRAVQWLDVLPDVCQSVNVAQLRQDAGAVRSALENLPPDSISSFDRSLLKPVQRVP